jgi:hypothetical protein
MHLYHGESRLTDFYWRLARRKGKKRAIVAMARKLLVASTGCSSGASPSRGGRGTPFIRLRLDRADLYGALKRKNIVRTAKRCPPSSPPYKLAG